MTTNTFPGNLLRLIFGDTGLAGIAEEKLTSEEVKEKLERLLDEIKGEGFQEAIFKMMCKDNKTKEEIMKECHLTEETFRMEEAAELRKLRHPRTSRAISELL